jgi:ligand-binding sensor domain-containing protein
MHIYIKEDINIDNLVDDPGVITQLVEDSHGNLWILTTTHLFMKTIDDPSIIIVDRNLPKISKLTVDKKGKIWIVSNDKRIYGLNSSGNNVICELLNSNIDDILSKEEVSNICIDDSGCIWVISSLGKIYKSDIDKQTFQNMSLEVEIEDCLVLNLLSDNENIWIVTNRKVIQYNIYEHKYSLKISLN